jgi:hypothetical protein
MRECAHAIASVLARPPGSTQNDVRDLPQSVMDLLVDEDQVADYSWSPQFGSRARDHRDNNNKKIKMGTQH